MTLLKVGDVVRLAYPVGDGQQKRRVLRIHPTGIETVEDGTASSVVLFCQYDSVLVDDPVALLGEIYRRRGASGVSEPSLYVGRNDNKVRMIQPSYVPVEIDYHPDVFERVR
jgi:hypothetical protein